MSFLNIHKCEYTNRIVDVMTTNELRAVKFNVSLQELKDEKLTTIVLRATTDKQEDARIYAILYINEGKIEYLNIGPSFISMDGEYRRYFLLYESFRNVVLNSDIYDELTDILEPHIKLYATAELQASQKLMSSRLPLYIYVVQWLLFVNAEYNKIQPIHINKDYYKCFPAKSLDIYKNFIKTYPYSERMPLQAEIEYIHNIPVRSGQKLQPISMFDIEHYGDYSRPIWRELMLSKIATDIVINNISPSFCIMLKWFLLPMDGSLFDNPSMLKRIENSDAITKTIDALDRIKTEISEYDTLIEAMDEPINVAKQKIQLSSKMLITISEYVGPTWANLPIIINNRYGRVLFGDIYNNYDLWCKYLFELIYGLYCMNEIMQSIHADLHLNNITLQSMGSIFNAETGELMRSELKNAMCHYNIDGIGYLFEDRGAYTTLIDFSRAVLRPDLDIIKNPTGELRNAVLATYMREFPEFYERHKIELEVACLQKPMDVWMLFTAYDAYSVLSKLLSYHTKTKVAFDAPNKQIIERIIEKAKYYLIERMISLFGSDVHIEGYPNLEMLSLFAEFTADNYLKSRNVPDSAKIISYYTFVQHDKMRFSLYDCKRIPSYVYETMLYREQVYFSQDEICKMIKRVEDEEEELKQEFKQEPKTFKQPRLKLIYTSE